MYLVFKRKAYRRENGMFVPYPSARKLKIRYCSTRDEARELCAHGPANKAISEGKEYRHLPFYEFESA